MRAGESLGRGSRGGGTSAILVTAEEGLQLAAARYAGTHAPCDSLSLWIDSHLAGVAGPAQNPAAGNAGKRREQRFLRLGKDTWPFRSVS